jgi:HAD superfamily hydrolase (TIGR01549 family)
MAGAAIFDIDGTLVDTVDLHAKAWQEALAEFGHDIPYLEVRQQIGKGGDQLLPALLPADELRRIGKQLDKFRGDLFKAKYLPLAIAFPRVRELFERLRGDGVRIVLASSSKPDEVKIYKRIARIEDLVDAETSKGDVESTKPAPDIFEAALQQLDGIDTAAALAIGDTPYDAEAAGKAGLRTIGMLCGGFPEAELRDAGCIAIYRDPADLLARYEETPLRGLAAGRAAQPA